MLLRRDLYLRMQNKTQIGKIAVVIHRPETKTEKLAILCPGYLDSKDYNHLVFLADDLSSSGYTVVRFDPAGTWESGDNISDYNTTQQLEDIKSIIEYMLQEQNYEYILLGGHSRGGYVSILYASRDPRVSVVLAIMSPYSLIRTVNTDKINKWKIDGFKTSSRDVPNSNEKREFSVPYSDMEDSKKYDLLEDVKKLKIPLVLVAGELDDVIPPSDVRLIYDNANEPKNLVILKNINHDYRHNINNIKLVNEKILQSILDLNTA